MFLEICVDNFESARAAVLGGADRIELCSALDVGGLSPSVGLLRMIRNRLNLEIPINCLIRPRAGDFCYEENDILQMIEEIKILKENGASGFVIGCLKKDRTIDFEQTARLVRAAHSSEKCAITFHRAFDIAVGISRDDTAENPCFSDTLKKLISINCDTLLTSGCHKNVTEGKLNLESIQKTIDSEKLQIKLLIGGGVNANVITDFLQTTRITNFHGSFSTKLHAEDPNEIFSFLGLEYRSNLEAIKKSSSASQKN